MVAIRRFRDGWNQRRRPFTRTRTPTRYDEIQKAE